MDLRNSILAVLCLVEVYCYAEISSRAAEVTPTGQCMNSKGWVMFPFFPSSNYL